MPEKAAALTLGIDLGTSAVKVMALAADGRVLATGSGSFDTISHELNQAEQDPADWMAAVGHAVVDLDRALAPSAADWRERVIGIGLTGQLPTLVCRGANGAIGRAVTWKDARADAWATSLIGAAERRSLYEQTGMPIDGRYLGPMYRFHWRPRANDIRALASAKDHLGWVLTDQHLTDPSTAAGFGTFDLRLGRFSQALCELWQIEPGLLPDVRPAHAAAGPLTASGARLLGLRAGLPVTVGAADSVCSAFAMAGLEEGVVCITMGSSTIILDAIREARLDPKSRYLLTPHVQPGWYGREMDLLATGTGYRWLSELFGWPEGALDAAAAESVPGARGLTFEPYLAGGEQGALWDPTLRGTLRGLTLQHSRADIARAFLEGVCFEIRRCVDVLAETGAVRRVVVAGHLVDQPASLQLLADVLDRPVHGFPALSPAALGAALGALSLVDPAADARRGLEGGWPEARHPGADGAAYQQLYRSYLAGTPRPNSVAR
jgi:sugar (pentulose or hexulose) kinase